MPVVPTCGPATLAARHRLDAPRVEVLEELLVSCPAQTSATAESVLRGLVGVARVRIGAEVHRTIGCHFVHDLAAAFVDDLRHVAQGSQMVLRNQLRVRVSAQRARNASLEREDDALSALIEKMGASRAQSLDLPVDSAMCDARVSGNRCL